MLEMVRHARAKAQHLSFSASVAKKTTTATRPPAENAWIRDMKSIFHATFDHNPGILKKKDQRGGPCPRFIAETARLLLADPEIRNAPASWTSSLQRFASAKKVGGRMESMPKSPSTQATPLWHTRSR
jgi:hypothetical protein